MQFRDSLTVDATRRIEGGAMAVRARAARTGVYQYSGSKVAPDNKYGHRDTALANVLRDHDTVFDEMDEAAIMAATVSKQMGDAAKDLTADQIAASFAMLTKDAKVEATGVQPLGSPVIIGYAAVQAEDAAYQRMVGRLTGKAA